MAKSEKVTNVTVIAGSVGLVGGLLYAFTKKKKFWGYVGFGLLFNVVGGTIGWVAATAVIKKDGPTVKLKNMPADSSAESAPKAAQPK